MTASLSPAPPREPETTAALKVEDLSSRTWCV